ncbi:MAG TPA: hypothetical protein VJ454_07005 [Steroidobacteraceae bacterium]|nr:hypothetical protein [Steroidobacteraceae bacterium]
MSGVRVVASAALSSNFDKRYVVVDEATGEVVDDAQGCGYKSAQNAHRAHAYKSMPPKKNTNETPPNDRPNAGVLSTQNSCSTSSSRCSMR